MKGHWLKHFFSLFFPNLCLACGEGLLSSDEVICLPCRINLPKTNMHRMKENHFTDRLWGRVPLQSGAAMYLFSKGTKVQALIHKLKYKNKPAIGVKLGQQYGKTLKEATMFSSIDLIVPVPLHPRKERKRGYNQSDQFAIGLSKSMKKPWLKNGLKRLNYSQSQTTKSRFERYANVLSAFEVDSREELEGKHILLVDDVLTTGATLEACASKILEVPNTKISMVTIAIGGVN